MNKCIIDLFYDNKKANKLTKGLPKAFEMINLELPGNPAVGILREHAIIGFFRDELHEGKIEIPDCGNVRGFDVIVCNHKLSIKTVTKNGDIKVLWTVDNDKVDIEIGGHYQPDCDIFLVQIYWNEIKDSVFYIPLEVQSEVFNKLSSNNYLKSSKSTNNRGIALSKKAKSLLLSHKHTLKLEVNWEKSELNHTPYAKWEEFWKKL